MADWLSASYPPIPALLAELRASWPPSVPAAAVDAGYVPMDLAALEPVAVLGPAPSLAIAIAGRSDGSFAVVPLMRDGWRPAIPGDGLSAFIAGLPMASERGIGVDQTNDSVVVGERVIVKWFRRVGPRRSRATLLLGHLESVGFPAIPQPLGTVDWLSPAGEALTLAQGDAFLPDARDGWDWCVERLERHVAHGDEICPTGCDPWIGARLGQLVARLHEALGRPSPVIPEPAAIASAQDVDRWRAQARRTLDDSLVLTAAQDQEAGAVLAALEPAMRAAIDTIPVDRPIPTQPIHGDLHVGQVLEWAGGLAVIDFDGNPALTGGANDLRQPAERDIAQMASSLDHVGRVVDHRTAGRARPIVDSWIARTRGEFLGALKADPMILAAFEVEQECRELVYAARFLPRWRYAPMATLRARFGGGVP